MSEDVQIILPASDDTPLCDMLVEITKAIASADPDLIAHGFLGGEFGYGGQWSGAVFDMRPFYWGECDCGYEARSSNWHGANPHEDACFMSERDRRWAAYDAEIGWAEIEAAAFGDDRSFFGGFNMQVSKEGPVTAMIGMPRTDPAMEKWRAVSHTRREAQAKVVAELYAELGLPPAKYQWHCSCGVAERAEAYFAVEGHYSTCALELPNFRHHASGMEVRWYKYIGRDMEAKDAPADLSQVLADCLADVAARCQ